MGEMYKAAFIVPLEANKKLGDDGWEFESENFLPATVKEFLVNALNLKFNENYLNIDVFIGDLFKASVFYDDKNQIEHVYLQADKDALNVLSTKFTMYGASKYSVLFIPSIPSPRRAQ